jgi:hypothetical protein
VILKGNLMKKAISGVSVVKVLAGAAGLVLAGFVILTVLPDVRRYIKISTM